MEFIKSLGCCVPGCRSWDVSDPHHIRTAANSGTGMKPADRGHTAPLCHPHHDEYHLKGRRTFEAKYGIDLAEIARQLGVKAPPGLV